MKQIISGDDLQLFSSDGTSLGYATSHTLTITGEVQSTSSKDHGAFTGNKVNKISWEATTQNLYTEEEYDALFDAMIKRKPVAIFFGLKTPLGDTELEKTVADDDFEAWSVSNIAHVSGASTTHVASYSENSTATGSVNAYTGKVYITSLVSNADTGANATYTATFTGTGKIAKAK